MKLKFANALSLALIMAMLFTSIGLADTLTPDADTVTAGDQSTRNLGTVLPGAVLNPTVSFKLVCNGQKHVDNGQTVNLTFTLAGSTVPAGGSLNANNASIGSVPPTWPDDPASGNGDPCPSTPPVLGDNGDSSVTITAPTTPGSYTYVVKYSVGLSPAGNQDASSITGSTPTATFTLIVSAPANTAPILSLPGNITSEATSASGAVVNYVASATDAEDNPDPTPSCTPASGSTFALGTTTVNCSVTDSGGMSASGSFSVTIQDTTAPVIAAHADVNAEATSASGAVVTYSASATDLVDGSVAANCSPASGSTFALGTTPVNCSATDVHSNSASGSFNVVIQDTSAPVLSLPTDITTEATGPSGAAVSYTTSASDLVDGPVTPSCSPASGSTFGIGTTSVGCSATDAHSNTSNGSFNVTVQDTTAPTIDPHGDETAEATSATGAVVTYSSPVTHDLVDGDGVAICLPASGSTFGLGDTTVNCNASDSANNDAIQTSFIVHVVDTTDPVITFVDRTPANINGWNNGNVTVNWSCTDLVGVVSASVSETVSAEGANQSATGTCEDTSGNTADDTQSGINIDKTVPTASASAAPAPNANGWNNTNVTVSFSGSDALSGVDFCDAAAVLSSEGAGQSASGTCTDKAGNVSASATASGINIDKTAPTASASAAPAPNTNGWNKTDVTVSFSGNDGSGSGIDFCDAAVVLSAEAAGQSASGTCTDKAGNVSDPASASASIDKSAPTVSLVGGPVNGGNYYFGSVPAAPTCSASDSLSGLDGSCAVSGYSTALGSHTVTASVADKAGNSSSASATYTVLAWTLRGFYQPVDMSKVNISKNGSTVPLKFEVFAGPTELTNTGIVSTFIQQESCVSLTTDDIETYATGGTSLRYDTTGGQFIFNWQTPKVVGGCYKVTLTLQDGTSIFADFKLK